MNIIDIIKGKDKRPNPKYNPKTKKGALELLLLLIQIIINVMTLHLIYWKMLYLINMV